MSNSAVGQTSGQCVKPKNTRNGWPLRSWSVIVLPFWSVRRNGPPIAGWRRDDRRAAAPGDQQHHGEAQHQPREERGKHEQQADRARVHASFRFEIQKHAAMPAAMISKNTAVP